MRIGHTCYVSNLEASYRSINMDEELFEFAKENDLTLDEAQEVQDVADEMGVDLDDALELWQEL